MQATVYVVVTYYGIHGDGVHVFGTQAEAETCVMEYAAEIWDTERLGPQPTTYSKLCDAWDEHDLCGSTDSRWELEERAVELPDPATSAAQR